MYDLNKNKFLKNNLGKKGKLKNKKSIWYEKKICFYFYALSLSPSIPHVQTF